ncbi:MULTISPECIES: protein DpdG [Pseudomonas fluorescens group]|jgi:hypothetical protein|uniref:protein DpdG n=1 Tax=Pseudomonas fluorescens TaxID=294 RepID=UPI000F0339D8|nr:protein DpdG [Pseudomonas fluorescens]NNB71604.1 hypothetical protein [Pseudomonas fluorescens]
MSLLNITNDGLPNILVALHATVLRAAKPIPETELLEAVAPSALVDDEGKQARNTLNRWVELGLFVREEGLVFVKDRLPSRNLSMLEVLPFTRRMACRQALAEENNPDIWASQGARAADLTRSLAWMLAQDIYRASFDQFEMQESQQILDPERLLMRNSGRRSGLQFWAPFLGFSRHPFAAIDPTVAVRDALNEVLIPGSGMPAEKFVERLSAVLPVLDGGRWQREVLEYVDLAALPLRQPGQISTALSRALLNLWNSGELLPQQKADLGSSITLTGANGARSDLTFQWITRPAQGGEA